MKTEQPHSTFQPRCSDFLTRIIPCIGTLILLALGALVQAQPLVELPFNEAAGLTTANTGSLADTGTFVQQNSFPVFSANVPLGPHAPPNNVSSVDFGPIHPGEGNRAIDFPTPLGAMTAFTISGWLNSRDLTVGSGGNRITFALETPNGRGFDLVHLANGALRIGVNQWPDGADGGGPSSSTGKITADADAGAGNWVFFAVTYDSALGSEQVKFYFGSANDPATLDVARNYNRGGIDASGSLTIGNFSPVVAAPRADTGNSRVFRGLIDEINVIPEALPLESILELQTSGTVTPTPPSFLVEPVSQSVFLGSDATFTAQAIGAQPLRYQWQRNNADILDATNASYTVTATTLSDNGALFRVVATNAVGSITSSNATLQVSTDNTPPSVIAVIAHRNRTNLTVVFSEPVGERTATDEFNYFLAHGNEGAEPFSVVLLANNTNVVLSVAPMILGETYTLSISGIQDLATPPNTMSDTNWTFTYELPPFPTDVVLWLEADSLNLANGDPVGEWPDVSGLGNHALQPDPARRPTFVTGATPSGKPVVRFSGASPFQHLLVQGMGPYPPPNTIFLVWKINQNSGADQQPLDGLTEPTRVRIGFQQNPSRIFAWSGGSFPNLQKAMSVPFQDYIVTTAVFDTAGGLFKVDGVLEDQNATGDLSITGFTIGRRFTESQALFGDIAEVIVFDRRLDDGEIEQVEAYLQEKWFSLVGGPVSITLHPVGGTFVEGGTVSLSVAAEGSVPMNYQWFRDGAEILNATDATLVLSPIRLNQSGAYTVRVSNTEGPVLSNPAIVTVTPDTVKPRLVSGSLGVDLTRLTVTFSEPIDTASVNLANIQVLPVAGGPELALELFGVENGTNLVLTTSPRTPKAAYQVIVSGIRDLAETPNEIEPDSQLVFVPVFGTDEETTWKFYDLAGNPPGDWKAVEFDDSSWREGVPVFLAYNAEPPAMVDGAPVRTGDMNWGSKVIFFRNSFQMTGPVEGASLQLRTLIDDGAIFFLNGVEIFRLGMPAGATGAYTDRASRTAGERGMFEGPFTISDTIVGSALREGENVMAVSVHQVSDTSSDLTFALEMDLTLAGLPGAPVLLSIERSGAADIIISWEGGGLRLQQRSSLTAGAWADVPNGGLSPVTLPIGEGTMFFRLSSE